MAAEDAMASLAEHWGDVVSRLDAGREQRLRSLLAQVGGPGHAGAVAGITQLLVAELPPAHPVRRALSKGYLLAGAPADWTALRQNVLAAAGTATARQPAPGAGGGPDAPGRAGRDEETPEDILAEVAGRLLRAPALSEDEVRMRGADPADPGLIRLRRPDGGRQWPSFQFERDGGPLPVARAVNVLLGAEADPLGVADWWLGANPWLDGRPCDVIGDVPDELLLRAAHAVIEEV